ncbi:MAG: anthranilate phosphoribosyltransferase [Nitrososphaerota archaeon]|nr:anthranilate phosphoribosyltransferase [Candidatus Bathyarchaeota archaeon]MDW8048444.1 anthranilate phosphoribosyltransferase [Nitrososphaerota archaeon]
MIKEAIRKLVEGKNLSMNESMEVMKEIMSGFATDAQIAAFLTALRIRGETIEEIVAFAKVMRDFCYKINPSLNRRLVDTCGTGGDKIKTFNVSTISSFVIAGAGVTVAKHGNRSITSQCGSADLLEKLGLNLTVEPKVVEKCIEEIGIGFMFAPSFHPAMKYAIGPRREMGIRTVFNILGPLTNPADAEAQLLGVYDASLVKTMADVLKNLGCQEALVVHGLDGLDEISNIGKTLIAWLSDGEVMLLEYRPEDLGIKRADPKDIMGSTPDINAEIAFKILYDLLDPDDPKREIVLLNSAAGIILGGEAEDFKDGIEIAEESIKSGKAYEKLTMLIKLTGGDPSVLEEMSLRYA